ncbi:membrane-associated guanylate kinase%2C WW and PDZ domain-containing protein 1 [Xyrichtys novacula]|uniref:Membrane-associated guanylate kinase, WW and PDZ domain-containing protein 1 n=1 Tax=Xyrichtys novacula TaxID=13765 RepID=A0AAV1HFJ0_XYRNO|nr:membrane-associated guanylate kinase%2C WW and PDZ domain-containing protein 1 [Xyrichtys novacula]
MEVERDENWDMAAEYRELRIEEGEVEREQDGERGENTDAELNQEWRDDSETQSDQVERPLPGVDVIDPVSQRKPFSFLTSTLSLEQPADNESESGGSQSDGSVSAASISGLSLAAAGAGGRRAAVLPGPWLPPSEQRVAQVEGGETSPGGQTEQEGGRQRRRNPFSLLFKRK